MKRYIYLFACLISMALCSCGGGGDDPVDPGYSSKGVLSASPTSLTFSYDDTAGQSFSISSRNITSWAITCTATWVHVSPTQGSDYATITVTVDTNTSGSSRTATLLITGGGLSREVTVTQNAPTDDITVTPTSMTFGVDGGQTQLAINCNLTWNITDYPSWCKVSSSSGNGYTTITVTATVNDTGTARSGNLVIKGTTSTVEVPISQEGGQLPTVTNFAMSSSGNYEFHVSASPATVEYGVCYSTTNSTPTISDTKAPTSGVVTDQTVSGTVSNLSNSTTYYFRAYATNAVGTAYSTNVVQVTTSNDTPSGGDNIPPTPAKRN